MPPRSKPLSRRSVAVGAVWSIPTIAVASTVPAFAASPCTPTLDSGTFNFTFRGNNSPISIQETFFLVTGLSSSQPATLTLQLEPEPAGWLDTLPQGTVAQGVTVARQDNVTTVTMTATPTASGDCHEATFHLPQLTTSSLKGIGNSTPAVIAWQVSVNGTPLRKSTVTRPPA